MNQTSGFCNWLDCLLGIVYKFKVGTGSFHAKSTQLTTQPSVICMKVAEISGIIDVSIRTNFERS
jgi:hypothetical protein